LGSFSTLLDSISIKVSGGFQLNKVLLVTTVSGFVPQFEMNNVKILQEMGYEVHYASNYNTPSYGTDNKRLDGTGIVRHQIDFVRSPFAIRDNIKVYKQLKKLMAENTFQLIHCHTPMGGAMARLTAKATKTGPVIYTVHGLHFYKGAPLINWLVYYPAEKYLSRYTDVLITINQEDYQRARRFHAKSVKYLPGVGIHLEIIDGVQADRLAKRKELGIDEKTRIILTVGELIKRKNYVTAINAFTKAEVEDTVLLICGHGILEEDLKRQVVQLGISQKVIFTGYRHDIYEIMKASDVFFFPSYQEGLSAALMEAMAAGLPVVCSKIRGNIDLIEEGEGGYLHSPKDEEGFADSLRELINHPDIAERFSSFNRQRAKQYDEKNVKEIMSEVYRKILCK
jgi:glycosyltransferase involved in cell wall biosynthesis